MLLSLDEEDNVKTGAGYEDLTKPMNGAWADRGLLQGWREYLDTHPSKVCLGRQRPPNVLEEIPGNASIQGIFGSTENSWLLGGNT